MTALSSRCPIRQGRAKSSTSAELDAVARADIAMWGDIVKASGFKPE
ncbi:MAG: hypothetical protein M0Q54_12780 [Pigmentiphaga sp.]|nr:hypothetical protein [Pigmentiphaga sp.]